MAIRTAHVAFSDFGKHFITVTSCPQKSDGLEFVQAISVLKLTDKWVALTAIDTRMSAEILIDLATQISAPGLLSVPVTPAKKFAGLWDLYNGYRHEGPLEYLALFRPLRWRSALRSA